MDSKATQRSAGSTVITRQATGTQSHDVADRIIAQVAGAHVFPPKTLSCTTPPELLLEALVFTSDDFEVI